MGRGPPCSAPTTASRSASSASATAPAWLLQHEDFGQAQIVAAADISPWSLAEALRLQPKGQTWRPYNDYRRMFDQEKLDGVFVETTTHARALVCLHVMQAGIDVYAEKPITLTVEEGQVLTRAARKLGRVLQAGTQQRSMPINIYASKLVSEGKIGKIEKVIVCNFIGPEKWTPQPEQPEPAGLDWDMWCNQTELRPYHPKLHREWATWWDYDGGGQSWGVSGWGTHSLDQVQAALGTSLTGPVEIRLESNGPEGKVTLVYASGTRSASSRRRSTITSSLAASSRAPTAKSRSCAATSRPIAPNSSRARRM